MLSARARANPGAGGGLTLAKSGVWHIEGASHGSVHTAGDRLPWRLPLLGRRTDEVVAVLSSHGPIVSRRYRHGAVRAQGVRRVLAGRGPGLAGVGLADNRRARRPVRHAYATHLLQALRHCALRLWRANRA